MMLRRYHERKVEPKKDEQPKAPPKKSTKRTEVAKPNESE